MGDLSEVIKAASRLMEDESLHDVKFLCGRDEGVVTSNRAYLAARCEYFRLLFSSAWREGGSSDVRLPHASSEALRLVLRYLFTARLPGDDAGWQVLMEACSLAQQYFLPQVVSFVAERLSSQLQPDDLGAALSYALQENLAPVLQAIWLSTPLLLQRPLRLGPSFSSVAVNFLLEHTPLIGSAQSGSNAFGAASPDAPGAAAAATLAAPAAPPALAPPALGAAAAPPAPPLPLSRGGGASVACAPAAGAMAGCCGGAKCGDFIANESDVLRAVLAWAEEASLRCDDCSRAPRGAPGGRAGASPPAGGSGSPAKARASEGGGNGCGGCGGEAGCGGDAARGGGGGGGAAADQLPRAGGRRRSAGGAHDAPAPPAPLGTSPPSSSSSAGGACGGGSRYCARHQQLLCGFLCRLNLQMLEPSALEVLEAQGLVSGPALVATYRFASRCLHAALRGRFRAGCGGAAPGAPPGVAGGGGALSSGGAGGGGGGGGAAAGAPCDGVLSHTKDGIEVLESRSPSHLNVTTWEPLTAGKHCWSVHVRSACDLVWLGVSDGSLDPNVWGGKQPGGWLYGSNDALCSAVSDKHAYSKTCGHGKWGDGTVVTVFLDMDDRKVWFAVNGSEPRFGFGDLPSKVYPTVSIRAPAVLAFHFRAGSWWDAGAGPE